MNITKYEHACVVIEEEGKKLVIDPGGFTRSFGQLEDIVAVVVTHKHADHLSAEHLQDIVNANPDVKIFLTKDAASEFGHPSIQAVNGGDQIGVLPFKLDFFGEKHAVVHPSVPVIDNVGVMVNDLFYYPGDSFTMPERRPAVLALPAAAPWMKIAEAFDFVTELGPGMCFLTHDAILSDAGYGISESIIKMACEKAGVGYKTLKPGDSVDI